MKSTPAKAAKGGTKLPPGATSAGIPGTRAADAVKGAARPAPTVVDPKRFGDHRGSPELRIGKGSFEVADSRSRLPR